MWWECSECGGLVERRRPPVKCRSCGTAGVIFVPADVHGGRPEPEERRPYWLHAGMEAARRAVADYG